MASRPGLSGIVDRSFHWARRGADTLDLAGKRIVVVGGTDGLGRAIARLAAGRGAKVTVVGRTFRDEGTANVSFVKADLSSMREAERVGRELDSDIDVLLLTTGIFASPQREVTSEGLERDMAVSYLSRLAILRSLLPRLGARPGRSRTRVFVMGFPGTGQAGTHLDDLNAERWYGGNEVHMNTVAGNESLVLDHATRFADVGFFGLNPGLIKTGIRANVLGGQGSVRFRVVETIIGWLTISAETYAARVVPLLFAPELDARTGLVFNQKCDAILSTEALTTERVASIVRASMELVDRAVASAST